MGAPKKKSLAPKKPAKEISAEKFAEGFEYICLEIEKGKPLRRTCTEFMSLDKFYSMLKIKENSERYARACEVRADNIFEDILNIADDNSRDTYYDENGVERTDNDVIQRSKLRVDARKWVLAKMNPKKFGDKIDVDSTIKGDVTINLKDLVKFQ